MEVIFADKERCVGCRHCEMACAIEHSEAKSLSAIVNETPQSQPRIKVELESDLLTEPDKCHHCDPAPCKEACPVDAIYHDEEFNTVQIEADKCISCGKCAAACPHDAIEFHPVEEDGDDIAYKCDQCLERLKDGNEPACVEACRTDALIFIEDNEASERKQIELFRSISSQIKDKINYPEVPKNIEGYKKMQEKIADISPLSSSKKEEENRV